MTLPLCVKGRRPVLGKWGQITETEPKWPLLSNPHSPCAPLNALRCAVRFHIYFVTDPHKGRGYLNGDSELPLQLEELKLKRSHGSYLGLDFPPPLPQKLTLKQDLNTSG